MYFRKQYNVCLYFVKTNLLHFKNFTFLHNASFFLLINSRTAGSMTKWKCVELDNDGVRNKDFSSICFYIVSQDQKKKRKILNYRYDIWILIWKLHLHKIAEAYFIFFFKSKERQWPFLLIKKYMIPKNKLEYQSLFLIYC